MRTPSPSSRIVALVLTAGLAAPAVTQDESTPAAAPTASIVDAAKVLIAALDEDEREPLRLAFDDPLRAKWSNLPASMVQGDRPGLRLGDVDDAARSAVFTFLESALSAGGQRIVRGIVDAERVLSEKPRAERIGWHPDNYWLAFFGEPSTETPWGWLFGGHHLAITATVVGGNVVLGPAFVGVEPAVFKQGEDTVRPMEPMRAAALALATALPDELLAAATIDERPREVLTGAGKDGVVPEAAGDDVADWPDASKKLLLDVVRQWVGMLPDVFAAPRLATIESQIDDLRFAWHGKPDGSRGIYFRIQSKSDAFLLEFSTQRGVGTDGFPGHYHSIYRELADDYGARSAAALTKGR